jgi:hypothetical protein
MEVGQWLNESAEGWSVSGSQVGEGGGSETSRGSPRKSMRKGGLILPRPQRAADPTGTNVKQATAAAVQMRLDFNGKRNGGANLRAQLCT